MKHGYASSVTGQHVWAWKRPDGQTWDVYVRNRDHGQRRIAVIVGTKRIAMDVCNAYAQAPRVPRTMELHDSAI